LPGIVHAHSMNCLLGACDLNVEGNRHSLLREKRGASLLKDGERREISVSAEQNNSMYLSNMQESQCD